ncbi:uncharacterized protein EV154DRAFT_576750 [Mucor mucedo]|uniref:uncharacterized protein n=1 Tax=Mucor mucedo TaxID=29922 RepID=UPI00221ED729|nr:uncharacterized protein EV154DRAFT_576750 [Mucor mucedo]KAI7894905.1 hypothetical protein EV154DRAFT_576750 [Mucor mucedo]
MRTRFAIPPWLLMVIQSLSLNPRQSPKRVQLPILYGMKYRKMIMNFDFIFILSSTCLVIRTISTWRQSKLTNAFDPLIISSQKAHLNDPFL